VSRTGSEKAPKHQRNDTLNMAAFKLGQLLPYGLFDPAAVTNDLARAAAEIGLNDHEIGPTIMSGLNAGSRYPRQLPFLKSPIGLARSSRPTNPTTT
jgi:putative DNA primase/helicase